MENNFHSTLQISKRFKTYTLAMAALVKAIKVLQERGADDKAVSFMLTGMDLLVKQLEQSAQKMENKKLVEDFLAELSKDQEE